MEVKGKTKERENRFTETRSADIENQATDKGAGVQRKEVRKRQRSDTLRWIESFQRLREGDSKKRVGGRLLKKTYPKLDNKTRKRSSLVV